MWIVVQPFGALDITSRHRFLLHTHLGRRHLGHEERAWQATSDPIVWGMDATRPGELLGAMLAACTGGVKMAYQTGPLRSENLLSLFLQVTMLTSAHIGDYVLFSA